MTKSLRNSPTNDKTGNYPLAKGVLPVFFLHKVLNKTTYSLGSFGLITSTSDALLFTSSLESCELELVIDSSSEGLSLSWTSVSLVESSVAEFFVQCAVTVISPVLCVSNIS